MTHRPILLAAAIALGALCQSNAGAQAPAPAPPTTPASPAPSSPAAAPAPPAPAPATASSSETAPAGDPAKGEAIFNANCSTCHTAAQTSSDSTVLSLFGIVGRKSGANADFSYSPAMQAANITWTAEKLNAYIENPSAVVPGNIMFFPGLADPAQRADLIAYLATLK